MMLSMWALRFMLLQMTVTDDSPVAKQHSRYLKRFMKSLSKEERRLCSRKIPRASFLTLAASPWRTLLASEVNQALITMTGFDGVSFKSLLQKFAPLFDDYPLQHESHPLEARSFERRSSKEGSPGGLSWPRARLDAHERVPNGVPVDFWNDMLQSLHVFALWPPRDR